MPPITLAKFPIRLPSTNKACCKCKEPLSPDNSYKGTSNKCKSCYKEDYKNKSNLK